MESGTPAADTTAQGRGCLKSILVGIAVVVVPVALFMGGATVWVSLFPPARRVVQPPTDMELFVANRPTLDAARLEAFAEIVGRNFRCDRARFAVRDNTERLDAVWRVHCAPSGTFEVRFDPSGKLLDVRAF